MSKIYSSFEDLLEQNSSLFKFFKQKKNRGLLQAIWQARQGEIDSLREKMVEDISSQKEQIQDLEEKFQDALVDLAQKKRILLFQGEKIKELEENLATLEGEEGGHKKEIKKLNTLNKNLEGALTINCHHLDQANEEREHLGVQVDRLTKVLELREEENEILKDDLQEKVELLDELKEEDKRLKEQEEKLTVVLKEKEHLAHVLNDKLQEKTHLADSLAKELEKNQAYIRTQKRLNKSMSDELVRTKERMEWNPPPQLSN